MSRADEAAVASEIKRGFVWLGAASAVARVIDTLSTLIVLWFMTREQMGLATLAWSVSVFLEAFNGFGIGTALVQAKDLDKETIASAFWYTMAIALLLVLGVSLCAPWLATLWGSPELVPLIRVSALKLLFVGAALIPLQQLNRAMAFERIALCNTLATLAAAIATTTLAALQFGPWALVLGQTLYGVVLVISAYVAKPYLPKLVFDKARVKPLATFGAKVASSGVLYHLYRNADYFFMGRYLGVAAVGVYRVGFDLAMTPTMTVLNVVNRAALPGYARLQENREALREAFSWTMRSLSLMLAPVTVFLVFAADDILALVNKGQWSDAAEVTALLSWAALLRSLGHLFPQLFHATGKPVLAVYDSLLSAIVLSVLFVFALKLFGPAHGVLVMGVAWLIAAPLLLAALYAMAKTVIPLSLSSIVKSLAPAFWGLLLLSLLGLFSRVILPHELHPALRLVGRGALLVAGYTAYLRIALKLRLKDVLRPNNAGPSPS